MKVWKKRLTLTENRMMGMEKQLREWKTKVVDLQKHTMKDNIVIHGIPESDDEDTHTTVMNFLTNTMSIDPAKFKMDEYDMNQCTDENSV